MDAAGAAGTAVKMTVTPMLSSPDGMRFDAGTLVVVEGAGRLRARLAISGDTATGTVLSNRLDNPAGLAKVGADYWVSEGQVNHLFSDMKPNIPFLVRRVPLF